MDDLVPEDIRRWLLTALDHLILITDPNLNVVGDPIADWVSMDVTLRRNEPGSGTFTAPGYTWIRDQLQPGNRVLIRRNGAYLISGPIEKILYERSDNESNAGDGMLTVDFADDFAYIAARLAYANPALAAASQTTDNWLFTGTAELAMRAAVNLNAGPGALVARRVPQLILGTLNGVGPSITIKTERFEPLGNVLRRISLLGNNLVFWTYQDGANIKFEVRDPRDLSGSVRMSFGLGNLRYVGYEQSAPTVTSAHVGGQGEGADRFVLERVASSPWGRLEQLVSRPGNDPTAELNEAGDQALIEGAATSRLQVSAMDTPDQRYGVHYGLGDTVAIEPWSGTQIADVVTTVHIQVFPTAGEVVSTTVGSQAANSSPKYIQMLRAIDDRVGRVERLLSPAAMTS